MNWLEITIYTSKQGIELLTAILMQLGITGFVVEDPDDFKEFLTLRGKTWDYMESSVEELKDVETNIKFYLAENSQGREQLIEIQNYIKRLKEESNDYGSLELKMGNVKEEDWANNWKQYFKPFTVGEKFVVKPTWETYDKTTNRYILEIDPNSSFGTGQHYTTQLCIEQLEKYVQPNMEVLDMGCGSGILSIATLILGANHVKAVDIDQNSVTIAEENLKQNKLMRTQYDTYCGNVLTNESLKETLGQECYDLVVANIVANVIIEMKEVLYDFLKPNGILIASGIINDRLEEVKEYLESVHFEIIEITERNDWIAIVARKG